MSTLNVRLEAVCKVTETLSEATAPAASSPVLSHTAYDIKSSLSGTSTPPVEINFMDELVGASGTIDLTALATADGTKDATGKKLQILRIKNNSTANDFVIDEGASNGYAIPDPITVKPGGFALFYFNDKLADVAAGDKTLDWTFASAQEAEITLILG